MADVTTPGGSVAGPAALRLRARWLFDGERFREGVDVVVADGTVTAVGADVDVSPDVAITDLGEVTLMPGIVDCHQHLVFDGNGTLEEQVAGIDDEELLERAHESGRRALRGGVTTVRDLGDRGFLTLGLRGEADVPTLVCSGPPITTVHGHCWYLGGEVDDITSLERAVAERLERGCDVVKIMMTGGVLTPTMPPWRSQFGRDELRRVVDAAHRAGVPVAAHCHGIEGIVEAVEAGVDTIEHCSFLDEHLQSSPTPELLERLAASPTVVSATLGRLPDAPQPPADVLARHLRVRAAFGEVHRLGGSVVLGSDAGIGPAKPHDVGPHALSDFTSFGMTVAQGLASMTSAAADAIGLPHKGRVVVGADADLLAVGGDIATDPAVVTEVVQVWKAGRPVLG